MASASSKKIRSSNLIFSNPSKFNLVTFPIESKFKIRIISLLHVVKLDLRIEFISFNGTLIE